MSTTLVISVAGIVVGAVVALSVAYMQRKQMRQIEAFRLDPKVGLIPPPHPIRIFVLEHTAIIAVCPLPAYQLVWQLFQHGPVTQHDVVVAAVNAGLLVLGLVMELIQNLVRTLKDVANCINYPVILDSQKL